MIYVKLYMIFLLMGISPPDYFPYNVSVSPETISIEDQSYWRDQMKKLENVSEEDMLWLARNIYFEARSENLHGKMAIAFVTMNRVTTTRRWPNTIKGVVTQKWQFSWYNSGKVPTIKDEKSWEEAQYIANLSVILYRDMCDASGFKFDGIVQGADHYFADYIKMPSWAKNMEFKTKIKTHKFYRDA